ncbi:LPXTG cell wall anchor domain-containing protein [Pimelobacter sp. 30-1]|uniref:LPXTG cell wall anchor domain-containing protein n=1 Tax=Pimelobacter sp. 30-1 TaxID=2004991 RepID=UPI001C054E4E|nr:LPXTG cell wall anchor domain-containing protein [Pimelobacter sp. 30-1]
MKSETALHPWRKGRKIALLLPAVLLASTAFAAPALADDVDSDPGTPAVSETPAPGPAPAPAPDPKPAPKPEPKPDPKPAPKPDPKPDPKPADEPAPAAPDTPAAPAETPAPALAPAASAKKTASVANPSAGTLLGAASVDEPNEKKVVVCKYVSTPPGVLHHIIIPSVNSLPGFPGTFPWAFADAQISVAIRYANVGEQAHDVPLSDCPTQIAKPVVPVVDDCGPGNAVYGVIPAGTYTAVRNPDGSITLTADAGYLFFGGFKTVSLPPPVETNTAACPQPAEITPPVLTTTDECGPGNAHYDPVPASPDYTSVVNPDGSVTLTAVAPATFPGGQATHTYPAPVDSNVACPVNEKKVVVCKYVSTPGGVLDHIIIVSVNTLKNFPDPPVFPWPFPDAQDSVAIRFAQPGEQAHDVSDVECPQAITPPQVPVTDDCGPGNAVYGEVPPGHYTVARNPDGSITLTADVGWTFPGGAPTYEYPVPTDSNVGCPAATITPPELLVTDDCGPGNAVYGEVPPSPGYTVTRNPDRSITLTAVGNTEFPGGESTYTYPAPTDSNVACPATIPPPDVDVLDPCGPDNAVYGEVPENPGYTVTRNEDGSITLTAVGNTEFPGGESTYTYPVPSETNTKACPVDGRAVVCSIPMDSQVSARRADIPGTILIVDLADLIAKGFAGVYPFTYTEGGVEYDVIRAAAPGETADQVTGITCGVAGVTTNHPPKTPGEVAGTGLPNTGGPAGWLIPTGLAMVLAGAVLVLLRRREA